MSSISKKEIYLDNAASTPIGSRVLKEMQEVARLYGNPSSFNNIGRRARERLVVARIEIARFLRARPEEVIFTASGSEANNLAIQGIAKNFFQGQSDRGTSTKSGQSPKPHIITTQVEHPSVLEPVKGLERGGFKITRLSVDKEGRISLEDLKKSLRPETVLVSVIYANNEIGTIQPILKISKIIKDFKERRSEVGGGGLWVNEKMYPFFHSDACQASEYLEMNVNNLGVDLMTFNGSKIYGPKGIGVLYKKRAVNIQPLIYGGDQEYGLRAGTENLPAIAGLAKAVSLIDKKEIGRVSKLRDYFVANLQKILPEILINGPANSDRLANNLNMSIPGLASENILLELDKYGIYASAGSACTAHSVEPSHVLKAIGLEKKYLEGALRFSLGRQTTKKDIDHVLDVLPKVISDLKKRYKQ